MTMCSENEIDRINWWYGYRGNARKVTFFSIFAGPRKGEKMGIFVENVVHRDRVVWRILQRFFASTPHASLLHWWPDLGLLLVNWSALWRAHAMQTACMPAAHEMAREGVNHACTCVHCGASGPVPPASPTWHTASLALSHTPHPLAQLSSAACTVCSALSGAACTQCSCSIVRPCVVTAALLTGE